MQEKFTNMPYSKSADELRRRIELAIEDHVITRAEMDAIIEIATADSHVDPNEQSLLDQLREMIDNKTVKLIP